MGWLVSTYDVGYVRAGLLGGPACPPAGPGESPAGAGSSLRPHERPDQENAGRKGGPYQQPIDLTVDLVPLTVPEIRRLLWALGQAVSAAAATHLLAWSEWRRSHQARARRCHYQRHLAHL